MTINSSVAIVAIVTFGVMTRTNTVATIIVPNAFMTISQPVRVVAIGSRMMIFITMRGMAFVTVNPATPAIPMMRGMKILPTLPPNRSVLTKPIPSSKPAPSEHSA
jgi:hypothetical protein